MVCEAEDEARVQEKIAEKQATLDGLERVLALHETDRTGADRDDRSSVEQVADEAGRDD